MFCYGSDGSERAKAFGVCMGMALERNDLLSTVSLEWDQDADNNGMRHPTWVRMDSMLVAITAKYHRQPR